ncbi:MAG: micrococcal nuclease [Verrucomicrobiales bacterium]|jgi:micrococcal nuclease
MEKSTVLGVSRPLVTGATLVVFAAVVLGGCISGSSSSVLPIDDAPEDAERAASSSLPDSPGLAIEVTRVTDGDSLRATSSEGDLEIRLLGINAPESNECFGSESSDRLAALLDDSMITLHPWPGERDEFGRQLGFLVAGETLVNLALVESGHVLARAQSNHGFEREFEEAETSAAADELGLWAPDACGDPVDAEVVFSEVFENAPGDDRQNPNGEYVILTNEGDADIDLEGWTLRDESTRHRFTFPSLTVAPNADVQVRTGCGDDDLEAAPMQVFWCDPRPPVWNNDGDTAFLLDPTGAIADKFVIRG